MLLLDEVKLCVILFLLVLLCLFLLLVALVLELDWCIAAFVVSGEVNFLRKVFFQLGVEGVDYSFEVLLVFGVVGVGFEEALVDGDQNLFVVGRDYLYLVGKLGV